MRTRPMAVTLNEARSRTRNSDVNEEGGHSLIRIPPPPTGISKSSPIKPCKNVREFSGAPEDEPVQCLQGWRECASSGCHACRLAQLGAEYLGLPDSELMWASLSGTEVTLESPEELNETVVYLYTRIGENPTGWPGIGVGREVGGNGQDLQVHASVMLEWLNTCLDSHPGCSKNTEAPLPTRLLEVQRGQDGELHSIRLTSTTREQRGIYAALSHCWGGTIEKRATRRNMSTYQDGILLPDLPQNFRDAVIFTSAVGLRHLWIDALCIIQDDITDWEVESGKMVAIYQNAYFVIGANISPNSHGGFLGRRHDDFLRQGKPVAVVEGEDTIVYGRRLPWNNNIHHDKDLDPGNNLCSRGPLSKRAWTLQESLLASRIINFRYPEITWTCCTIMSCQCGWIDTSGALKPRQLFSLNSLLPRDTWSVKRFKEWYRVVHEVARRDITKSSDILPCLSGLAQKFHSAGAGKYLAGLWLEDLSTGLLWQLDRQFRDPGGTRITPYRGPSWSWVSIHRPVFGRGLTSYQSHNFLDEGAYLTKVYIQVLEFECEPRGKDPFGEVSVGCFIVVSGPLFRLRKRLNPPGSIYDFQWEVQSILGGDSVGVDIALFFVYFDERGFDDLRAESVSKGQETTWSLYVLFVGELSCSSMRGQGLVLNRGAEVPGRTYERVGMFEYHVNNAKLIGLGRMVEFVERSRVKIM
jgi:hypothetical protein